MQPDLSRDDCIRLKRYREAYRLYGGWSGPFIGISRRQASMLLFVRWLRERGAFDDDLPPNEPLSASWAQRFFAPLASCWASDSLP